MKFSTDDDALLLLVSCQDPGHKFGCDTVHAQFFSQNLLACPITNYHHLSNVVEWYDVDPDGRALEFVQLVGLPVCSSSSTDVQLVLNWACH